MIKVVFFVDKVEYRRRAFAESDMLCVSFWAVVPPSGYVDNDISYPESPLLIGKNYTLDSLGNIQATSSKVTNKVTSLATVSAN